MIGYKDQTWCDLKDCRYWKICERALTEEAKKDAERWWGAEGAPIAVASFAECFSL